MLEEQHFVIIAPMFINVLNAYFKWAYWPMPNTFMQKQKQQQNQMQQYFRG